MKEIKQLLDITKSLKEKYNRGFTLDGKLVGDIGEVLVAKKYGIELYPENSKLHDGFEISTGKKIQIKATFKGSSYFKANLIPDYFIVVLIKESGEIVELYNGTGQFVMENLVTKRKWNSKHEEYSIERKDLEMLNNDPKNSDKIQMVL
ncbi:MAG: hypothetical protein JNL75_08575 [Chitinophagales bacterium]|nr:hypothetical protein [Chitinophagales bacterium]